MMLVRRTDLGIQWLLTFLASPLAVLGSIFRW